MMRSPHAWAIACRKPSGEVSTHSEPLERLSEKRKWMAWPVIRGVVTLGHAMTLGFRALKFSANVALDELQPEVPEKKKLEISGWMAAVNIVISVGFFIFMYKFLPLLAATELKRVNPLFGEQIIFNLVDGVIRIALFLLFIWGVSLMRAIFTGCTSITGQSTRRFTLSRMAIRLTPRRCRNIRPTIRVAAPVS